jgi:hypothetical protein
MIPHTIPYRIILSIIFLSYTAIHVNNIRIPVHSHTLQLASPPNASHLSSMTYPTVYRDDPPPPIH